MDQTNDKNENVFYSGNVERFNIKTHLRCSNKECKGNESSNPNAKIQRRLYSAAKQMEEDVNRHILKDNPHGEQVCDHTKLYSAHYTIYICSRKFRNGK